MRRKGWRRIKYEGEGRRRHASAFDAARELHDAYFKEWKVQRVAEHEEHGQGPLYHYTSGAGFEGILSSGRFWATHIRDFDDEKELRHAFAIAAEMVDAALARTPSQTAKAVLKG